MLYFWNTTPAAPGMVPLLYAILIDAAKNLAMSLGHTIVLTSTGAEMCAEPALSGVHGVQLSACRKP